MARARVADLQPHIDEAARGFADQLLRLGDPFARDELQRRQAGGLLEHPRKMEGAQFHQRRQRFDRNLLGEVLAQMIFHLAKLPDRQAAAEIGFLLALAVYFSAM